jgi:hypothetical protein
LILSPLRNFPLALAVVITLNCHPSVYLSNLHSLWIQKSDHRSQFLIDAFCHWNSHVKSFTTFAIPQRIKGTYYEQMRGESHCLCLPNICLLITPYSL